MKNSTPNGRFSQPPKNTRFTAKEGRSGYEPSDTETEWQETPRHERERKNLSLGGEGAKALNIRNKSPVSVALHRRHASRFELESSSSPPRRRHHSKSPYKPFRPEPDGDDDPIRRNISPLPKPDHGRHLSPYKSDSVGLGVKRSVTAPRQRGREKEQHSNFDKTHGRSPSIAEINEMVAEAKFSKDPRGNTNTDTNNIDIASTESSLPGDIFFSRECNAMLKPNTSLPKPPNINVETEFAGPRPKVVGTPYHANRGTLSSSTTLLSRSTTVSSTTGTAGRSKKSISGKQNNSTSSSSVKSDASGKTSASMKKFVANRKKNQTDVLFACMRIAACKTSNKSPENRTVDEASIIEKALVVQSLPQFWADKYQPASLDGFICHQNQAQLLKQLASQDVCPHIMLKGPPGSGKRALAMALMREIYGDACSNISHDLRKFPVQERRATKVSVPITSSSHHIELNVNAEPDAKYALMGLVKEISGEYAITPEVSNMNFKSDYKVLVLYEVEKAGDNIQHMIKWIMDRYSDICKLVVCCEDDVDILEPVKNRMKLINVDAPLTHESMDVLLQIAKLEEIDVPMNFAAKIVTKSKQNLRNAIMALEACKAQNYPFSEEQPIPVGWEDTVNEISAEILDDPSYSRLFSIRGKLQKLLVDFVHPKLILRKLVEQLLKGIDASLKRELFYWHAYYDKRLPPGTTALLKLEEFVAKFMSIYRKSSSSRQVV